MERSSVTVPPGARLCSAVEDSYPILGKAPMEGGKSVELLRWLLGREDVGSLLMIVTSCLSFFLSFFFS